MFPAKFSKRRSVLRLRQAFASNTLHRKQNFSQNGKSGKRTDPNQGSRIFSFFFEFVDFLDFWIFLNIFQFVGFSSICGFSSILGYFSILGFSSIFGFFFGFLDFSKEICLWSFQ